MLATAGAMLLFTGTALAGPPAPSNPTIARANQIMSLEYEQFVQTPHEAPFEWSTDGCSSPVPADPYRTVFDSACRQHDFGYRNYGAHYALKLSVTRETKDWIDTRFSAEMRQTCEDEYVPAPNPGGPSDLEACLGAAGAYSTAVRRNGDPSFF